MGKRPYSGRGLKRKHVVELVHVDDTVERVKLSAPVTLVLAHRLVESGWPYIGMTIDGHEIVEAGNAMNVFLDTKGNEVVI